MSAQSEFRADDNDVVSPGWHEVAKKQVALLGWSIWSTLGRIGPSPDPAKQTDQRNDGLATIGWITAILIPVVGLVVGIMLSSRNDRRGVPIAITAVVVIVGWIAFWVTLNIIVANSVSATGY
ncbi:MAG: hypothetical protein ACRD3E_01675 [Terriglobales bacterium]